MKHRIFVILLSLICTLAAEAAKEPRMKPVYIFGFAASFTDSVACQTVVQRVDSAWVDSHGFLVDRALYSLQLQMYMEQEEHLANAVTTVFFSRSERKMQRLWAKMQRKYEAAQNLIFHVTPAEQFRFTAEEYRPAINYEMPVEEPEVKTKPQDTKAPEKPKKKKES
ncbi:MAG: hypothetical protein IJT75_05745 [Bacteroidaceae bacterium]|nr:hypothetical protein [Bacteroidaceae bacterium]